MLGITLTQSLRYSKHIDDLSTNCFKRLDLINMKALKWKLDRCSLETIYFSFTLPTLDYGDILFAGTYYSIDASVKYKTST